MEILKTLSYGIWDFFIYLDREDENLYKFIAKAKLNKKGISEFNSSLTEEQIDKIYQEIQELNLPDLHVTETILFDKEITTENIEWENSKHGISMFIKSFATTTKSSNYISNALLKKLIDRFAKVEGATLLDYKKERKMGNEKNFQSKVEKEAHHNYFNAMKLIAIIANIVEKKGGYIRKEFLEERIKKITDLNMSGSIVLSIETRRDSLQERDIFVKEVLQELANRLGLVYDNMKGIQYVNAYKFFIYQGDDVDEIKMEYGNRKHKVALMKDELKQMNERLAKEFLDILNDE